MTVKRSEDSRPTQPSEVDAERGACERRWPRELYSTWVAVDGWARWQPHAHQSTADEDLVDLVVEEVQELEAYAIQVEAAAMDAAAMQHELHQLRNLVAHGDLSVVVFSGRDIFDELPAKLPQPLAERDALAIDFLKVFADLGRASRRVLSDASADDRARSKDHRAK